ncbi:uncharacterized protein LOC111614900 [Centruroides sculpturatus]|uniref:uncharacterized protein LOC111614900 n=1 Tax=Centruroides sculpturatus TaxID=218467 RepID=UPI000C6E8FF9|nr:uncharacterized protein LOC111614900 [Centruroides sculpturatus]
MKPQKESRTCPTCLLKPVLMAILVFGVKFVKPCQCSCWEEILKFEKYYNIYYNIVEVSIWIGVSVVLSMFTRIELICTQAFRIFGDGIMQIKFVFFFVALCMALQNTILKRAQISFVQKRSSYAGEEKLSKKIEKVCLLMLSIIFFISVSLSFNLAVVTYPVLKKEGCHDIVAIVCCYLIQLITIFVLGQIMSVKMAEILIYQIINRRYEKLSEELQEMNPRSTSRNEIEEFIEKQTDVWEIVREINEKHKYLHLIEYGLYLYLTCFLLYGTLFVKMPTILQLAMWFVVLSVTSGTLFFAFLLSNFTSKLYDNFSEIRKLALCNLSPVYKFKILCFAKRYGKTPLGFSMAGFIVVKKDFFIKVAEGLYSVFNAFLELRGSFSATKQNCVTSSLSSNKTAKVS